MKSDSDWKIVIKMESKYISYFMDLKGKKTCGSRDAYCIKSGIHTKLVTVIKMCFKASCNKVCIGNMCLIHFTVGMV